MPATVPTSPLSPHYALLHLPRHTLKQLKFLLPGGLVTYLLGTCARLWNLAAHEHGWAQISANAFLACGVLTICLFLYILLVPWLRGVQPNYSQWRKSGELARELTTLTVLLTLGWPLLTFTLCYWTDLGVLKGMIASSGLYALTLGIVGLVPAPIVNAQR